MQLEWLQWYVNQTTKRKNRPTFNDRYLCPCCYMPTLTAPAAYEICSLCFWEDDGQDTDDADDLRGGPNGNYTLTEARANFVTYCTMYRPEDTEAFNGQQQYLEARQQLYQLYLTAVSTGEKADWRAAIKAKKNYNRLRWR